MIVNMQKAQIATILTLVMVVIFLLIAITINIGNIAQEKTMISNACDGAALLLASTLGSLANSLRMELELYGDQPKNCDIDFLLIGSIIALIASIIFTIATFGAGSPTLIAAIGAIVSVVGSAAVFGFGMWNALATESPGAFRQIELKFQNMTFEQRIKEKTIQYALFAIVSDPNKIVDTYDEDMDGDTTDHIHRFFHWYNERLKALPRLGAVVEGLWEDIFSPDLKEKGKVPRIFVQEDPKSWLAVDIGFWIDTNSNDKPDTKDGGLKFEVLRDDPHDPAGVVYAHDIYFTDWLDERFVPLAQRLYEYGYGLTGDLSALLNDIDNLKKEILEFEDVIKGLYGATADSRLESFDVWMPLLYDGTPKQDWSDRMQEWSNMINLWKSTLEIRTSEINADLASCSGPGPWICGPGGGECCESYCLPCPPEEGGGEGGGGEGGGGEGGGGEGGGSASSGLFASYNWNVGSILLASNGCPCGCECSSWCGCGPGMDYGRLCPARCKPNVPLNTPTGGVRQCCDSVYYLHNQLCDPGTYCSGSGGPCGSPCCDTYHNCGVDNKLNHITREHADIYLEQFVKDVDSLRKAFEEAFNKAQSKKDDPRFYEALYEWTDKAGIKGELTEQPVRHIAYVKLSNNLKPNLKDPEKGFQFPYIHQWRQWFPLPARCAEVAREKDSFNITVARYDEDVGKLAKSPLRNLWRFKTRQQPSLPEADVIPSVDPTGFYVDPAADPNAESFKAVANFVMGKGIISQTEGHYGPGKTYKPDEIANWDTNKTRAIERNRDIKIKRLK